jgi:hypothetical protein
MKRAIIPIVLPMKVREFELEILKPGRIHNFVMGHREVKTLLAQPGVPQGQRMMEEVPTIVVEVDPDETADLRKFVVVEMGQAVEAWKLIYIGSTMSQAGGGTMFHLFEEIEDPENPRP